MWVLSLVVWVGVTFRVLCCHISKTLWQELACCCRVPACVSAVGHDAVVVLDSVWLCVCVGVLMVGVCRCVVVGTYLVWSLRWFELFASQNCMDDVHCGC